MSEPAEPIVRRHPDITARYQCTFPGCEYKKRELIHKTEEHIFRIHLKKDIVSIRKQSTYRKSGYSATPYRPNVTRYLKKVAWVDEVYESHYIRNALEALEQDTAAINKENEAERERVRVAEQEKAEVQVAAAVPPIAAVEEEQFRKHQHALKVMMRQVAITQAYHNGLISS